MAQRQKGLRKMTPAEAKALYKGKTFFIKRPDGTLDGPRNDIYYVNDTSGTDFKYVFIQVTDGTPQQLFTKDEILVVQEEENGK